MDIQRNLVNFKTIKPLLLLVMWLTVYSQKKTRSQIVEGKALVIKK